MSLIKCPECSAEVSDAALKCPKCGAQIRKPKRGFFGKLFKWGFILFNLLMVFWLVSYWGSVGDMMQGANDAEKAGGVIGTTIGTGMIFGIWGFGDLILGLFVLLTRPK
ncbi:zinc ribbon domain-containing protein [Aeromonas veronii]